MNLRELLAARGYRGLLAARTVSLLGNAAAPVALSFAVLSRPAGSAGQLGAVLTAYAVAQVALLLVGGVLADRLPRTAVMAGADAVAALAQAGAAAVVLLAHAAVVPLAALAALSGAAAAVFGPAAVGVVPTLVPGPLLHSANALLGVARNVASVGGAALGGVLVVAVGPGWALAADAATFAVSGALLLGVPRSARPASAGSTPLQELREGWREFTSRRWVWVIVAQFSVLLACAEGGTRVLGPVVAKADLGGAGAWATALTAESAGLVCGSVVALRLRPRRPMLVATLATFSEVLPLVALALRAPVAVLAAALFLVGVCMDVFTVLWVTALHHHVPEEALSRVSAYDGLGSYLFTPLGLAAAGPLAGALGTTTALWCAAGGAALVCVLALLDPGVRGLTDEAGVTAAATGEGPPP
ncbi:putative MFS family arabinose efflux permease [Motilibacter rhizosphaerae]|uniref:Putative MFS family arabinose efflux permease n=1 Tax=Motilibacter rhizosphaerae TaxID=598652 RepID=A0A4Q7NTA6_9ACTN|nr:MFS transporter [Motilibacter rhizosphaerae]RZS90347.1 putative MFS family arabinose efflux permease [Motilibacter rhizosphaerae]